MEGVYGRRRRAKTGGRWTKRETEGWEEEKSPWCSPVDPEDRVLTIVLGAEL